MGTENGNGVVEPQMAVTTTAVITQLMERIGKLTYELALKDAYIEQLLNPAEVSTEEKHAPSTLS